MSELSREQLSRISEQIQNLIARGDYERAQTIGDDLVARARSGAAVDVQCDAVSTLASVLAGKGDFARAEKLQLEAVGLGEQAGPFQLAPTLLALWALYHRSDRAEEARKVQSRITDLLLGMVWTHQTGIDLFDHWLRMASRHDCVADIIPELQRWVEASRRQSGRKRTHFLTAAMRLQQALFQEEQFADASILAAEILQVVIEDGVESPMPHVAHDLLAEAEKALGNDDRAASLSRAVLQLGYGQVRETLEACYHAHLRLAVCATNVDERVQQLAQAEDLSARAFGPDDPWTIDAMEKLASALAERGDHAGARDLLQKVVSARAKQHGT